MQECLHVAAAPHPEEVPRQAGTGPPGIAGLPKQQEFCGPMVYGL
jgi:hypothetical protein